MAALLVSLVIMSIMATVAMPVWKQAAQREKEAELIFRAGQVAHAIEVMRRKIPNAQPPDLDFLVKQRFLRKKYKDPMTKDGEWRIVTPQELQGVNMMGARGGTTPGQGQSRSGFGTSPSARPGASPGSGVAAGPGGVTPTAPGGLSRAGGSTGTSSFGVNSPSRGTVNMGPVAAVASKSTQKSIRIFKGRDRYDQWIVTIDDVMPRQLLRPQQPNQPGQPGRPGRPGPGSSRPGFGSPRPSGLPSRP